MSLLAQDERLTRRVGTVTLLVVLAALGFVVFVLDRLELGSPVRIRVYFANSTGLREHAPIVVAGRAIGRIEAIEPVAHGGTNLLLGEEGSVAIVAIDGSEAWKVPRRAEIFVSSRGMLSERYLEVAPPSGDPGAAIVEGSAFRGADPPSLDRVLERTWGNMTTFRLFVEQVAPELEALQGQLATLRTQLDATASDLEALRPALSALGFASEARALVGETRTLLDRGLGGQPGRDRIARTITTARGVLAQARASIDRIAPAATRLAEEARRLGGHLATHDPVARTEAVLAELRTAIAKVDPLLATAEDLAQRLSRGEGSLGRLMNDPEFPEDAKELGKILKRKPWKVMAKPKD